MTFWYHELIWIRFGAITKLYAWVFLSYWEPYKFDICIYVATSYTDLCYILLHGAMGQLLQVKCLWKFENHWMLHMLSLGEMDTFQLRNKILLSMRTWKIIQFVGGATMLAAFSFTFIIWMHIVLHIKCRIWIEHISQTTNWILMKFG